MAKTEVFKIQRPMSSTTGEPYLIYNEDRSIFSQMEPTQELVKLMAGAWKIYVNAYVDKDGILQIESVVKGRVRW